MPRRKQTMRVRRIADRDVEHYRELLRAGCPWLYQVEDKGRFDLMGLVDGPDYGFGKLCIDDESRLAMWDALRDVILEEHIKRRPGRRPAAWWRYEAPEPRRVVRTEPSWKACGPNGYQEYECDPDYLKRLDLLTETEKELVEKYEDIYIVRVASGAYGECKDCWREAEEWERKSASIYERQLFNAIIFGCRQISFSSASIASITKPEFLTRTGGGKSRSS